LKALIRATGFCVVVLAALALAPTFASAQPETTCTGTLAPGTYTSVVVPDNAVCFIEQGPLTIRGGLTIGAGATFVFGSEETPDETATISGGVHATNAKNVQIHFATINGGVDIHGGPGVQNGPPFGFATWTTIEDSVIHGGATIEGYDGFWMGFIRNTVYGDVNLNNNVVGDPDGNEYVTNTIHGSLNCDGDSPDPQIGDSEGSPNQVTGPATGECADIT
jgi:hypothetical protein